MAKRVFDIGVSAVALLLLALPLTLVALAVRLVDGRPVFYLQRRIGRGGRPFWLYKFRTMRSAESGPVITTQGDHRITPTGQVLRRWKIDELPQLWNVLRSDMSIVGPRPEAERLVRYYTPEQRKLLEQTPGLASMSQLVYPHEAELLQGHSDPEETYITQLMPKKIAVDLEYEHTRTFLSDLRLLGELARLVMTGKSHRTDRDFRVISNQKNDLEPATK
jgi:lipopolysaccharide/colanic/teichoic acid biosynthesis glycosyltransferase